MSVHVHKRVQVLDSYSTVLLVVQGGECYNEAFHFMHVLVYSLAFALIMWESKATPVESVYSHKCL